jgi:hypothetical protein
VGDAGQRFGEGSPGALGHGAAEPTDPDEQDGRVAETGHVAKAAPVEAMDPPGRCSADGAGCRWGRRLRAERDPAKASIDLFKDLKVVMETE